MGKVRRDGQGAPVQESQGVRLFPGRDLRALGAPERTQAGERWRGCQGRRARVRYMQGQSKEAKTE